MQCQLKHHILKWPFIFRSNLRQHLLPRYCIQESGSGGLTEQLL